MTIYIDVVIIENICMNYLLLLTTGKINKCKLKHLKIIFASVVGTIYVIFSLFVPLNILISFILKLIISAVMIYASFTPKNLKALFREVITFYLVTFAFGGCAFALLYFLKPAEIIMKNGLLMGYYPLKVVILAAIVAFAITTVAFKNIKGRIVKKNIFCEVEIFVGNNKTTVKAIVDTGNMLKEPITRIPVIVVESGRLNTVLDEKVLNNIERIINGNVDIGEYITKLKVIPFTSLGKQNGLLLGFKPDSVNIKFEEEKHENIKAIIGIYDKELTKTGVYNALVGLDILEGGEFKSEHLTSIKI